MASLFPHDAAAHIVRERKRERERERESKTKCDSIIFLILDILDKPSFFFLSCERTIKVTHYVCCVSPYTQKCTYMDMHAQEYIFKYKNSELTIHQVYNACLCFYACTLICIHTGMLTQMSHRHADVQMCTSLCFNFLSAPLSPHT